MQRNRRAILGALLVVVAFGLTAATLTNPTDTSAGSGSGPAVGSGDDSTVDEATQGAASNQTPSGGILPIIGGGTCVPFLTTWQFLVLATVGLVLGAVAIRRRVPTWVVVVMLVAFLAPLSALHGLVTTCGPPPNTTVEDVASINGTNQTLSLSNSTGGGGGDIATSPPVLLIAVIVVAIVLVLLVLRGSGDDEFEDDEPEEEADDSALEDIGDTAGAAADRIESASDLENAVYQAWWEMTTHLDIDSPETTTPAEFAAAARAAGMQADHVETLTDLFREVRYGGEPVTDDRERRALDALRDIEATYAEEDG